MHYVDLTAFLSEHESGLRRFIYESAERKPRRRADRDTNCSTSAECMCVQPQPVPALVFEPKIVRCPQCTQTATTRMTTYFDCWPALAMLWCVHTCSSYLLAHITSTPPLYLPSLTQISTVRVCTYSRSPYAAAGAVCGCRCAAVGGICIRTNTHSTSAPSSSALSASVRAADRRSRDSAFARSFCARQLRLVVRSTPVTALTTARRY